MDPTHLVLSAGIVTLFVLLVWHALDSGPISDADAGDDDMPEDDDGIERVDI